MLGYILRRILAIIPVMLIVAIFVFLLLRLTPGDPAAIIAGDMPKSAFAANSQAKLCAHAILAELFDVKAPEPAVTDARP